MLQRHFTRVSPEKYQEHMIYQLGWIVLSHRLIDNKAKRRRLHGHWVKLISEHGVIYRVASFNAHLRGTSDVNDAADIVIDWAGWLKLYGFKDDVSQPIHVSVTEPKFYELAIAYFQHPEPFNRLNSWVSFLFTAIGVVIGYVLA